MFEEIMEEAICKIANKKGSKITIIENLLKLKQDLKEPIDVTIQYLIDTIDWTIEQLKK
ncbi:MAG: hypothetical protein SOX53_03730 [Candidatus Onthovivens sp.]|nr:hypothetical protein [Candidatus Onthovivens sp.]